MRSVQTKCNVINNADKSIGINSPTARLQTTAKWRKRERQSVMGRRSEPRRMITRHFKQAKTSPLGPFALLHLRKCLSVRGTMASRPCIADVGMSSQVSERLGSQSFHKLSWLIKCIAMMIAQGRVERRRRVKSLLFFFLSSFCSILSTHPSFLWCL